MKVFAVVEKINSEKLLGLNEFNKHFDSIYKERKSKSKCSLGNIVLHELAKKKHINELVLNVTVHLFPFSMSQIRTMNSKINHLHERCLRIVCRDRSSSFEKLLGTGRSVPMHFRNLQILAIERFSK